jgi:flagellar biosynthetic protein FliO
LALVLVLVIATAWLLTWHHARRGSTAGAGRLTVLASQVIDPRTRLILVRCDAREYLLAVGQGEVAVIATVAMKGPGSIPEAQG